MGRIGGYYDPRDDAAREAYDSMAAEAEADRQRELEDEREAYWPIDDSGPNEPDDPEPPADDAPPDWS